MLKQIQIAVLDDHYLIGTAIEAILQDNESLCFYAGFTNCASLQNAFIEKGIPDFLLLDVDIGEEDGLELCKRFSKEYPALKIIMLSSYTETAIVKTALKNGAKGFLPKSITKEVLQECIEAINNNHVYLHKEIENKILQTTINTGAVANHFMPKLSRREKEILNLILEEMTTQQIAETLFISVSTVETHRAALFSKTGSKNIAGLVKVAIEKGLIN